MENGGESDYDPNKNRLLLLWVNTYTGSLCNLAVFAKIDGMNVKWEDKIAYINSTPNVSLKDPHLSATFF